MPPEIEPGRGQGRGGRGRKGSAADATAVFKVDDSALRNLNTLWEKLVSNVKAFNAELRKIDASKLNAAARAAGGIGGAGGGVGGGRPSTINAGTFTPAAPLKAFGVGGAYGGAPLHPGYGPQPDALPGRTPSGQRTVVQAFREDYSHKKLAFGLVGANTLYGLSHKESMVATERMAQMTSWGESQRSSNNANERIRHDWAKLPGYTDSNDLRSGLATMQAVGGYSWGAAQRQMAGNAGRAGNVMGSMAQGAQVEASLTQSGTYWNLMQLGVDTIGPNGVPRKVEEIAEDFLRKNFQGRKPSAAEVAASMGPTGKLRANMAAFGLDPAVQQYIEQYGTLAGKIGAGKGGGTLSAGQMSAEMSVTGGKSKAARAAVGSTAYDAGRHKEQEKFHLETEIADHALPALRAAFNTMASTLDGLVTPVLGQFGGAVVGTIAGLGAALAGPLAAAGGIGGGMIGGMAAVAAARALTGGGLAGLGGAIAGGARALGGGLGRAAGAVGRVGARALGVAGLGIAAGQAAGYGVDKAGGPDWAASGARWGGAGAGVGFMVGGPMGAAIGGTAGTIFGVGKGLITGGERGGGNDSRDWGSRETVDVLRSASSHAVLSSMGARQQGSGKSSVSGEGPANEGAQALGGDGPVSGGTSRGAAALAWMLSQHKNPSKDWTNLCLQDVRMALGVDAKHPDASTAWYATKKRHTGTPPPGVPVWWTGGYGHVALSAGGGYVWSNDILRKGKIDKVTIDYINKKWGKPYHGWTEDINGVDVYDGNQAAPAAKADKAAAGARGAGQATGTGQLTAAQVFKYARDAGFDRADATLMTAIAGAESTWHTGAYNPDARTGDKSYGLWQINMIDKLGPERRRIYGLKKNEELFDPRTNARVAWELSRHGSKFSDWSTYNRNEHGAFMKQAREAAKSLPSYAEGAYKIEGDQLALIHHGEMVLPAEPANRVRDYVRRRKQAPGGGQPSGGATVNVTLNMPVHVAAGTSSADAQKLVAAVVRAMETDHRLAAVMAGD